MPVDANCDSLFKGCLQNLHLKPYINGSAKANIPTVWPGDSRADLFEGSQLLLWGWNGMEWVWFCLNSCPDQDLLKCGELLANLNQKSRTTQRASLRARNFHQELQLVCIKAHQSQIQAREQGRQCLCEDNEHSTGPIESRIVLQCRGLLIKDQSWE